MALSDLTSKIADIHEAMEAELGERVRVFEGADLATVRREAHKLRGGFPHRKQLTRLAGRVEELAAAGDESAARRAVLVLCEEARRIAREPGRPASTPPGPSATTASRRILVVDDDASIRRLTITALARLGGHEVSGAESADGVLERAAEGLYDLIIADAMMPGIGGVELALTLRERAVELPVVLLSAATAEELGAAGRGLVWWQKPLGARELVSRVAALFGEE